MKRRALIKGLVGFAAVTLLMGETVFAADMSGFDIMKASTDRHDRPIEYSVEEMKLVDADGNVEEVRSLRRYARQGDDGLSKYLLTFDSPAGVKGVAMLTWETKGGEDDQWTFLPAFKKLKRIVGGGKRNYFLGTDFANEDLVEENLERYRYERQADQPVNGVPHYVVVAYPETKEAKKSTGYNHREIFIRQDDLFNTMVKFYERRTKKHVKTLTVTKESAIDNGGVRADESVMDNHKEKHKTISRIMSRDFDDAKVPAAVFKKRYITKKKHIQ
jgi:hypothetical protein